MVLSCAVGKMRSTIEFMFRIGLTGGIAAGKSAASHRFQALGITVIDHDQLARAAVAPGSAGLRRIVQEFGPDMLTEAGELDRPRLGSQVFGNPKQLEKLNAILHPEIYALSAAAEQEIVTVGNNAIVVHDIPLLIETGQARDFDELVVVMAPEAVRLNRLVSGRGLGPVEARRRITAQTTDEERRKLATVLVDGAGSISDLNSQIDDLVTRIRAKLTVIQ